MSVAPPPRVSLIRRHDFVPTARIRIALAGDDDVEAMAAFYRAIWTKDATAESVRASRQDRRPRTSLLRVSHRPSYWPSRATASLAIGPRFHNGYGMAWPSGPRTG